MPDESVPPSAAAPQAPAQPPAVDPARSVFINCPYDPEYEPLFDALIFSVVCCGFTPRSATESGTVSEARMERIFSAIFGSYYSIHDLSRCQGEGERMLARFNMPLELGIAMTRRRDGPNAPRHDWLVLVPKDAPYAQFVSDLAGFDPFRYDGTAEMLVRRVMSWLVTKPGAVVGLKPVPVIEKLEAFRKSKADLKLQWADLIPWRDLVNTAAQHAPAAG
jgi:hypothetical protein